MTAPTQDNQQQTQETRANDKELNFKALEAKVQQERNARLEMEKQLQQMQQSKAALHDDEDDDPEPYVDHKRLEKKLSKMGQSTQSEIHKAMEMAKHSAKEELKQELWLENNPDFYDTLKHADKLPLKAPKLADSILRMPESFERQKLVYENIKALGLDRPEQKEPSIQDKIDANRRGPYYQPSGVASAPYAAKGDFSDAGKKNSYEQMQQLKARLRLG